jgi:hypothetical protein
VLVDDLQKMFVVQAVTNLVDGNKIILDYEPVPNSVKFTFNKAQYDIRLDFFGKLEGQTFTFKPEQVSGFTGLMTNEFKVEYVRKSIR